MCANGGITTFELLTGQALVAPAVTLSSVSGVMHLTECLNRCLANDTCKSVNFQSGLCVLMGSSADQMPDALKSSQFPLFTIFGQKVCLKGNKRFD